MASFIKRKFFKVKKPSPKIKPEKYESCVADYDESFKNANKILNILCLKLDLEESQTQKFSQSIMFWFMMMNVLMATVLEGIIMIVTVAKGTLLELFTMMPCVGYLLVAMSKASKIKRFKPVYQNIVDELRNMWPVGEITEEEHDIITEGLRSLRNVVRAYLTVNVALGCIFILPPYIAHIKVYLGFEKKERLLPFFYWFPFDPFQDNVYEAVVVLQSFHCLCTISSMICGDLCFCIFLSHITTQFSLMTVTIKKMFYVPVDKQLIDSYPLGAYSKANLLNNSDPIMTKGELEKNWQMELVKIVHRHQALIRLAGDVENMYTFSLLVNFMNSSIIICFCLFCVTFVEKWNEFIYKIFFTTAIFQIWSLCWYGQKLLDTSTGIGEALYNSGWYSSSHKMKKSILIMIHRSQKPVYVTTFGFSIISLESYATILKTSWSYFTLLINMYKG